MIMPDKKMMHVKWIAMLQSLPLQKPPNINLKELNKSKLYFHPDPYRFDNHISSYNAKEGSINPSWWASQLANSGVCLSTTEDVGEYIGKRSSERVRWEKLREKGNPDHTGCIRQNILLQ